MRVTFNLKSQGKFSAFYSFVPTLIMILFLSYNVLLKSSISSDVPTGNDFTTTFFVKKRCIPECWLIEFSAITVSDQSFWSFAVGGISFCAKWHFGTRLCLQKWRFIICFFCVSYLLLYAGIGSWDQCRFGGEWFRIEDLGLGMFGWKCGLITAWT